MEEESPSDGLNPSSVPFFPGVVQDSGSIFGGFSWSSRESSSSNSAASPISGNEPEINTSPVLLRNSEQFKERNNSPLRSNLGGREFEQGHAVDRLGNGGQDYHPLPPSHKEEKSKVNGDMSNIKPPGHISNGSLVDDLGMQRPGFGTPPLPMRQPPASGLVQATSPSSLGSDSLGPSQLPDLSSSLEGHIRNSSVITSLLDRVLRCETSTRQVQNELGILHQKVDMLLERSLQKRDPAAPEFKNPFAVTPTAQHHPAIGNSHRPSLTPKASQQDTLYHNDEMSHVTARLNTLTSSVTQLLALQTQQSLHSNRLGPMQNQGVNSPMELAPKQHVVTQHQPTGPLGHGFPQRPDLRGGARSSIAVPTRTWSTGNLDLQMRGMPEAAAPPRQDAMFRGGKRGSVATIQRRESSAVSSDEQWSMSAKLIMEQIVDPLGEGWGGSNFGGNAANRDPASPSSFKWENLPIAQELLRSIAKFGVGPPNKVQQRALPFLLKGSDIIAQAPPTQERIAAYVIPAIHLALTVSNGRSIRGPLVVMISTTVDQANQAQRMIKDLGGPIGIRSSLGTGSGGPDSNILQEVRVLQQNMPHIICGTPQKLHALFTAPGGLSGSDVRLLVLDEVDQLIARNLQDFVYNIVKLLPPPRSRPRESSGSTASSSGPETMRDGDTVSPLGGAPIGTIGRQTSNISSSPESQKSMLDVIERQTALFSNTVPQDVLNLANTIQLREPVRVLVRRDGNVTHTEGTQGTKGLRQFYLYLAFTGGTRKEAAPPSGGGLGIIGSGRGATNNPETAQAREWKLDALADLFQDLEVTQAIVHVGGMTSLESVVYKLANRGLDPIPLHSDMNATAKAAALNKFRVSAQNNLQGPLKALVIYDVLVKAPDVYQIPLVINYDLPKAVEEYAQRVAPAISSNYARAGVVVNFVTATGGDVEMLRSIECFYKIKCPEVPTSLRDLFL